MQSRAFRHKFQEEDAAPWVMNDMITAFSSMILILAIIFLIVMRFDEFTDEHERRLLEVDAQETDRIVYELQKGIDTDRRALEQEQIFPEDVYQGNYGGTVVEDLSFVEETTEEFTLIRARLYANGTLYSGGRQLSTEDLQAQINSEALRNTVYVELEIEKETAFNIVSYNRTRLWEQSAADHFRAILVE